MTTTGEATAVVGRTSGYVVLIKQRDGTWQPDWNGLLHADRAEAEQEARDARGHDYDAEVGTVVVEAVTP